MARTWIYTTRAVCVNYIKGGGIDGMNFELCIDCRLFVRLSSYYFSRIALTLLSELVKDYQKVSLSTTPKVYLISRQ